MLSHTLACLAAWISPSPSPLPSPVPSPAVLSVPPFSDVISGPPPSIAGYVLDPLAAATGAAGAISFVSFGTPSGGGSFSAGTGSDAGKVVYIPALGFVGADSVVVTVSDGTTTTTFTMSVTVTTGAAMVSCVCCVRVLCLTASLCVKVC